MGEARIRRVSRIMSVLCVIGMVALPVWLAVGWWYPQWLGGVYPQTEALWGAPENLSAITRTLGFLVSMVPAGLLIYGLSRLRAMFGLYQGGEIFSARAARCLQHFAVAVLLQAILNPIAGAAHSVIVTFHNPPGERMLTLSLGNAEYSAVLLGGLLLVIAWIMGEGAKMADENRQFV